MSLETMIQKIGKAPEATSVHHVGTPVMGIELLEFRPHWTSLLCEMGISKRPVYQMTPTREQALGDGNCARATARGIESCAWLGNVMSKSDAVRT